MIKSLSQTTSCFCLSEVCLDQGSTVWLTSDTEQKHTLYPIILLLFFFCYFLIYSITVSHNWLWGQKWHIYVINCSLLLKTDVNVKKQNLCTVLSQSRSDMGEKNTCLGGGLKQPIKKKEVIFSLQLHPVPCFCSCFRNWILVPLDLACHSTLMGCGPRLP